MATARTSRTLMTADELLKLPGDARRELIGAELHEMTPAGGDHGRVAARIARLIDDYADGHGGDAFGAETGFRLASDPDTVRAPNAAYVGGERARSVGASPGYWPGAPDLAVEVVSPGDPYHEVHEKALMWLAAGSFVVLVVDPAAARVTRYRSAAEIAVFDGDRGIDCSPAAPGFAPTAASLLPVG